MPWWEYRMAVEGVNEAQLPQRVELVTDVDRSAPLSMPDPATEADSAAFEKMGLTVTEMG
jgi:hypothetical protein